MQGSAQCLLFRFWQQQDSNPRPGDYHMDVLPLRQFDPPRHLISFKPNDCDKLFVLFFKNENNLKDTILHKQPS